MANDMLIVAGLLRKDGQILLVRQQGRDDPHAEWSLPGGVVGPDELLIESLVREVREETGIEVLRVGELIHVVQSHHPTEQSWSSGELPHPGGRATAFVFEVAEWKGEVKLEDPDEIVREARFWPSNDAIEHLQRHPSRSMSEPIVAYLQAEERDRVWLYRRDDQGHDRLEWPVRELSTEVNEQLRRARALIALGCIVVLVIVIVIVVIGIITLARPFV